jgi:DNA-binding LytR/AlgR family response regulator
MQTLIANGEAAAHAQLQLEVIAEAAESPGAYPGNPLPPQIIGEKSGRIYFIDAHQVEYLASAGNYVVTHVGTQEFLTRATLKGILARLLPLGFVQIERSLLINLRRVAHVERYGRGQFCFVMRSGARLVSSRERGGDLRELLLGATSPQHL